MKLKVLKELKGNAIRQNAQAAAHQKAVAQGADIESAGGKNRRTTLDDLPASSPISVRRILICRAAPFVKSGRVTVWPQPPFLWRRARRT